MKFLGTLAFGFSSIAAMLAALLSFGFHVKVESPMSPQQSANQQQLLQCTAALSQAEQQVAEAQARAQGLDLRLKEAVLVAEQTSARLSTEVAQRVQMASEKTALAGTSTSVVTGFGVGLLMFPIGFLFGRRRSQGLPLLTARGQSALVVDPPREPVNALPLFDARRPQPHTARTGAVR